jgi:hypothetical protein
LYFGNVAAGKPLDINDPQEDKPFPRRVRKEDPAGCFFLKDPRGILWLTPGKRVIPWREDKELGS